MALRFAYWILIFHALLLMSYHANGIREVSDEKHSHGNIDDVVKEKSLQLYYKILGELFKRPAVLVSGKGLEVDDFVYDYIEGSYIGRFTPGHVYPGKVMPIYFPVEDHSSHLPFTVPRQMLDPSITYPLSGLEKIFIPLPVIQDSPSQNQVDYDKCEIQHEDETKICARDVESVSEFIRQNFRSEGSFRITGTSRPESSVASLREYVVLKGPEEIQGPRKVFCHPMTDAFYCHSSTEIKVFKVVLGTENGSKMETTAICHRWDIPGHNSDAILHRMLGIKPGASAPACHFLPGGHFVWVQSPSLNEVV